MQQKKKKNKTNIIQKKNPQNYHRTRVANMIKKVFLFKKGEKPQNYHDP